MVSSVLFTISLLQGVSARLDPVEPTAPAATYTATPLIPALAPIFLRAFDISFEEVSSQSDIVPWSGFNEGGDETPNGNTFIGKLSTLRL